MIQTAPVVECSEDEWLLWLRVRVLLFVYFLIVLKLVTSGCLDLFPECGLLPKHLMIGQVEIQSLFLEMPSAVGNILTARLTSPELVGYIPPVQFLVL